MLKDTLNKIFKMPQTKTVLSRDAHQRLQMMCASEYCGQRDSGSFRGTQVVVPGHVACKPSAVSSRVPFPDLGDDYKGIYISCV